jgi:hypothetical protein
LFFFAACVAAADASRTQSQTDRYSCPNPRTHFRDAITAKIRPAAMDGRAPVVHNTPGNAAFASSRQKDQFCSKMGFLQAISAQPVGITGAAHPNALIIHLAALINRRTAIKSNKALCAVFALMPEQVASPWTLDSASIVSPVARRGNLTLLPLFLLPGCQWRFPVVHIRLLTVVG